ncbi:RCC1-like domain-containing protein [Aerococcus urinaeequi]
MNDYFDQHKSLSAGSRHLLIIDKNNDVIANGNNKNGQCNVES